MSFASGAGISRFANLRTGTKIYTGFGLVLGLLVTVSGVAWHGLSQGQAGLSRFEGQANMALLGARADAALNGSRLAARSFLADHNPATAKRFEGEFEEFQAEIRNMKANSRLPENQRLAEEALGLGATYGKEFARLAELIAREDRLTASVVNDGGLQLRRLLAEIRSEEEKKQSFGSFALAARADSSFLLARIVVGRFLDTEDAKELDRIRTELATTADDLRQLDGVLTDARQRSRLADAVTQLADYRKGFDELATTVLESQAVLRDVLVPTGEQIDEKAERIRDNALKQAEIVRQETHTAATFDQWLATGVSIAAILVGLLMAWLIARAITRPVVAMTGAMGRLAEGDLSTEIPAKGRRDEIGRMADTVQVFKDRLIRNEEMERTVKEQETKAREEQRRAMNALADDFERSVGAVVETISSAATELEAASQVLAASTEETNAQASTVAAAATQASANVHTVAAACEELGSSVRDIGQQVTSSARSAESAVEGARRTNETVVGLSTAAQKIGEVVQMIQSIAAQTNLLALNATIEAARAGEAGRGFAVVASEVKTLANQTARATEEIATQVQAVQSGTGATVEAIREIGRMIGENREIATGIAAAVEQQDAATQEIARNVQQASQGTGDVSQAIVQVSQAAAEGGSAAAQVQSSAQQLAETATALKTEVGRFIERVRAA